MELIKSWFRRTFSDPQIVILVLFILIGLLLVIGFGRMLAPVFASLVLAYLLEGVVIRLERIGMSRIFAVVLVFLIFMAVLLFLFFGLIPMLSKQLTQLVQQIPTYLERGEALLRRLPEQYPQGISQEQIDTFIQGLGGELTGFGQRLLSWSVSSVVGVVSLLVFLVLVPILVFFFLKDKQQLTYWVTQFMPRDRSLVSSVWKEVDMQIANYVRGKAIEILIVGAVSYVTFIWFGLQYSALLATAVGFSVLVPYIGAAVVGIPVALVAFFQFGASWYFAWICLGYAVIQMLDGNVLVPWLFSEVVNLHPVAIIVAVLVFGGLWGFWGVFFAIPLATLVNAIIRAWPKSLDQEEGSAA